MIWLTKKLKESKTRKAKCEARQTTNAMILGEIATSMHDLNRNITENTELLKPMIDSLVKFLEVQLEATQQSVRNYEDFKPTEDDKVF